jgi:hypothetical protein
VKDSEVAQTGASLHHTCLAYKYEVISEAEFSNRFTAVKFLNMEQAELQKLLRDLAEIPRCDDWGAKLQWACETLWNVLGTDRDYPNSSVMIDQLISLLNNPDAMEIARLVIPELRTHANVKLNDPSKQKIIDGTMERRSTLTKIETTKQDDFDDPLYKAEKQSFSEAEMYRASLLLYGSAAFDEVQEKEILEWLSKRPRRA